MKNNSIKFLLLAVVAVLVVAGCGNKNETNGGAQSGGAGKSYSIAISQYVEHPSLDATREGFLAALKDAGIEEGKNLKVSTNFAQADSTINQSIVDKIAADQYDLVLGIATPSVIPLADKITNMPLLFAAVTDPIGDKIIDNMEKPGGNVSGASDTNPEQINQLMDFIAAHFPNVKNLGIVINEGEGNAVAMAKIAEENLTGHGIKLVRAAAANSSEVKQAAESLVGRADAIWITLDNTVVSSVNSIIDVANENNLPFFSSDRDTVEAGAFATVGFKYFDHGYQVGQMAVEVLKNGKNPGDMQVSIPDDLDLILNMKAATEQGISVTDAMKDMVKDKETNIIN